MRLWRHWLLLPPALVGGWCWFGVAGALPLALWWWRCRPRRPGPDRCWLVNPVGVRAARLGPWRTTVRRQRMPTLEILHDEIDPADLARLRRLLKDQLAAG